MLERVWQGRQQQLWLHVTLVCLYGSPVLRIDSSSAGAVACSVHNFFCACGHRQCHVSRVATGATPVLLSQGEIVLLELTNIA